MTTNIKNLIDKHVVIAFIKGEKHAPACKFSYEVINILNTFNIDYYTVNVLTNNTLRENIKLYSQWPTIPQIYINSIFIGGAEILINLYKNNELQEILEQAFNI
uniref:Glutaredoxin n=1 Tax=Schimmelmannia schousboei TaxID=173468 RepID=A0A1C9C8S4_9FLOR|nr:glutaredoxin [Schimmelmannia schousboei]AOM64774.1 glutaredoxin [Schimmelmannia schousboei]